MKKFLSLMFVALVAMCSMTSCVDRIDAGSEGIYVSLYGDDRGIGEVSLCTGWVFYNPLTHQVFEYPAFVQTVDYEPFTINAKDGSEFTIDPNINIKIEDGKSPVVFKKYRKELKDVINGPVLKYVKDACRIEINRFTTDQIVNNREAVENAIEKRLIVSLKKEGFIMEPGSGFTSGLKYPQTIVEAVNAKNKAVQEAQKSENELKVAEAEAKKKIVAAEAAAEAYRLQVQTLDEKMLRKMWIDKWDGTLPTTIAGNSSALYIPSK